MMGLALTPLGLLRARVERRLGTTPRMIARRMRWRRPGAEEVGISSKSGRPHRHESRASRAAPCGGPLA